MKQVKLLFIITLLCTAISSLKAQNLATWTFTNASGDWGSSPKAATSSNSNLTVVGLTRGSGVAISGTAAGTAWGGNGFFDNVPAGSQTAGTAVTAGNFITFSFTADAGYSISVSGIPSYNIRKSSTGPAFMIWQYSLDGTTFTNIGSTITIGSTTTSTGNTQPAVSLSGIADLQNIPSGTTVTFRAVMWGSTNDGGTWYLNGATGTNFAVNGTVVSTPLSLDLISFKGQSENNVNELNWITANEKDVARFEVERSTGGSSFESIALVTARNENTAANHYAYMDEKAPATAYYRLKMIDMDGTASYSNVVVLRKDNEVKYDMRVYPNPATNTLFIENLANASSYVITDATGRKVTSVTVSDAEQALTSIDISGLRQGVYFLTVNGNVNSKTVRFMKK